MAMNRSKGFTLLFVLALPVLKFRLPFDRSATSHSLVDFSANRIQFSEILLKNRISFSRFMMSSLVIMSQTMTKAT